MQSQSGNHFFFKKHRYMIIKAKSSPKNIYSTATLLIIHSINWVINKRQFIKKYSFQKYRKRTLFSQFLRKNCDFNGRT